MTIDNKIIEKFNDIYLVVWDRFGITVGDLQTALLVIYIGTNPIPTSSADWIATVISLTACQYIASIQRSSHTNYNRIAQITRNMKWLRIGALILASVATPLFLPLEFASIYLGCCLVRERDLSRFKMFAKTAPTAA